MIVDDELMARLRALRLEGHQIALDDVLPRDELAPLLPLASYVKVDLAAYGIAGLIAVLDGLPENRPMIVATNCSAPSASGSSCSSSCSVRWATAGPPWWPPRPCARLCEKLAIALGTADPDTAFTAGILSTVDALLDKPLIDVVRTLPATEDLRWALLGRTGPVGTILDVAIRLERNRIDDETRFDAFGEVATWTDRALDDLV